MSEGSDGGAARLRFNMGCGRRKAVGYVNVDAEPASHPDQVWDLERTPWPWPDGCASEIRFIHSLEHMGQDPKVFLAIMREIYRIAAPGCRLVIWVPHPRHNNFLSDPTHVRPIIPDTLRLFDRQLNDQWQADGAGNTPLAHYLGVDFRLTETLMIAASPYREQLQAGLLDNAAMAVIAEERSNTVEEIRMVLEVRKA